MAGVRCADLQARPIEFLDFTSLTLDEFPQLVPPFEGAFQARMAAWRMEGQPRTARRFTVDHHCPLPTPEDRRFFLLTSLKPSALQVVQGRLFGMVQGTANPWMHVLLPPLLAALRPRGAAPALARLVAVRAAPRDGHAAAGRPRRLGARDRDLDRRAGRGRAASLKRRPFLAARFIP